MLSSQWKMRTVYRARSICFVYVSHERSSSLFRNGKWSPPFFFFLSISFLQHAPRLRALSVRAFFLRFPLGFFFALPFYTCVNINRRHEFRPRARIRWRLPSSRRARGEALHETTPGGPFEWPIRDGLWCSRARDQSSRRHDGRSIYVLRCIIIFSQTRPASLLTRVSKNIKFLQPPRFYIYIYSRAPPSDGYCFRRD